MWLLVFVGVHFDVYVWSLFWDLNYNDYSIRYSSIMHLNRTIKNVYFKFPNCISLVLFSLYYWKKLKWVCYFPNCLKMTGNSNQQWLVCRMVESAQWTSIEHQIFWWLLVMMNQFACMMSAMQRRPLAFDFNIELSRWLIYHMFSFQILWSHYVGCLYFLLIYVLEVIILNYSVLPLTIQVAIKYFLNFGCFLQWNEVIR